jgi:L-seryl-tRNA(Ser) seleniumtransferase
MHRLLNEPSIAGFYGSVGAETVKETVDGVLARLRRELAVGAALPAFDAIVTEIRTRLEGLERAGLTEVVNGTGIVLHTNLGRASLAPEALAAMSSIGGGYSNLEYDLELGERGSRYAHLGGLLRELTKADDALVVNNCAAAVLLILDTFAKGREVVVARNQLIEIGGGFRLPDVLARSGATLVEVGATNKVYLRDFERALGPQTALLLRSHTSNYRIEGFVADVAAAELAHLGKRTGVAVIEDLGSGALVDLAAYGLAHERTVGEAVADGVDLVAFSGDKLLGGPQAGIIVGRAPLIARLRANPLLRALRVDKATLAGLAATLRLYLQPGGAERVPIHAMLAAPIERLRERAEAIRAQLGPNARARVRLVDSEASVGGGAAPLSTMPSVALAIAPSDRKPNALADALRRGTPPIVGRVTGGELLLDLRTIEPRNDAILARGLSAVLV